MDLEAVREKMALRIGEQKANHIVTMIMPMIISDFYKLLTKAKPNNPVKEEYRIENNTITIEVYGYGVKPGESPQIARVCMDRLELWKNENLNRE